MSNEMGGSMRDVMPGVAGFIDACRVAFGAEEVDGWIRAGMKDGTFWAEEAGHTVGVKPEESTNRMNVGQWLEGCKLIEQDRMRRVAADKKGRW